MANNRNLLKEAIADAKAVKETAIANAKAALEESFGPFLREKLSQKISEMEETDENMEYENQGMKDEMVDEVSLDELLAELEEGEVEEELYEAKKEEKEEEEEEDENISIEDMSEDDLKSFIESVIKDMVANKELEAGHEGMENEEGAKEDEEELKEIDLNELLNELELEEETLNEMASFYKIKDSVDITKNGEKKTLSKSEIQSMFKRAADATSEGSAMHDILSSLAATGEADLKKFSMEQGGKDMAKWNNVPNRNKLEKDGIFAKYLDAGSSPSNVGGQGRKGGTDAKYDFFKDEEGGEEFTQDLEESMLNEMASFYKVKDSVDITKNGEKKTLSKSEIQSMFKRAADATPKGSAMHDILDSLAATGEADLKKFSMEQGGKDMAKWNNVPNRNKLEKDGVFAKYLDAGSSPSNKGGQGRKGGTDAKYDFFKDEEGGEEFTQDLEEAYSVIKTLKSELNEINVLNAKLLYTNKIFRNKSLTEQQKIKVLTAFDRATSKKEVELIYETLQGLKTSNVTKSPIRESLSSASKALGRASAKPIIENDAFARMRELAFGKK